jgi:hypothetical protein
VSERSFASARVPSSARAVCRARFRRVAAGRGLLTALALMIAAATTTAEVHAQDWRTLTYSRAAANEDALRVDVEYGAGQLKLGPAPAGMLYRTSFRYDADAFQPRLTFSDSRLRIGIEGRNVRGRNLRESLLDLRLSPDVPIDLRVAFGAADAAIDLGGIRIRSGRIQTGASRTTLNVTSLNQETCDRFEVEVGAAKFEANGLGNLNMQRLTVRGGVGEVMLDFTGDWQRDLHATVEMGLGSLTLRVPRGLGVRVEKGGLLASFDSQGLVKRGDVYFSEDWDRAEHKLTLDIDAALGSIRVQWMDS